MTNQRRPKPIDIALLRLVAEGETDPLDLGVPARLTLLRAQFGTDPTYGPMVREASDMLVRALEKTDEDADRAYLEGMLDGTVDLLSESTFPRMEPMFAKYPEGSKMFALLERAAAVFGDAVEELASWVLAGVAIEASRRDESNDDR